MGSEISFLHLNSHKHMPKVWWEACGRAGNWLLVSLLQARRWMGCLFGGNKFHWLM